MFTTSLKLARFSGSSTKHIRDNSAYTVWGDQDEGLIFLWVTGRAMELGRECLKIWGYERVDELIWVKTNQLQRIIRTGMYCTYSLIEQDPDFNCKFQCYIFQVGQGIGLIMEKNIV